jgi:hypothetical protein
MSDRVYAADDRSPASAAGTSGAGASAMCVDRPESRFVEPDDLKLPLYERVAEPLGPVHERRGQAHHEQHGRILSRSPAFVREIDPVRPDPYRDLLLHATSPSDDDRPHRRGGRDRTA